MNGRIAAPRCMYARNLLDNSNFSDPVNQRGIYTASNGSYIIDRWIFSNASSNGSNTISITPNGIIVSNDDNGGSVAIIQRFIDKNYYDGKYTVALKTTDGLIFGYTAVKETESNLCQATIWVPNGRTIEWAALYEGSYTADTLPPYTPKEYAVELAQCKRRYQRIKPYTNIPGIYMTSTYVRGIFFPSDDIDSSAALVLESAEYYKGSEWKPFTPLMSLSGNSIMFSGTISDSGTTGDALAMRVSGYISNDL